MTCIVIVYKVVILLFFIILFLLLFEGKYETWRLKLERLKGNSKSRGSLKLAGGILLGLRLCNNSHNDGQGLSTTRTTSPQVDIIEHEPILSLLNTDWYKQFEC